MKSRLPILIRVFERLYFLAHRTQAAFERWQNDLLSQLYSPTEMTKINQVVYTNHSGDYDAASKIFQNGLFSWEKEFFHFFQFPSSSTFLVSAIGGGREAYALLKEGHVVIGFEPNPVLLNEAKRNCEAYPHEAHFFQASYEEILSNPKILSDEVRHRKLEGIILGWGSFGQILTAENQRSFLKLLHSFGVPVLVSFLTPKFPSRNQDHDIVYFPRIGFHRLITPEKMKVMASESGYDVVSGNISPYPHVFLLPT